MATKYKFDSKLVQGRSLDKLAAGHAKIIDGKIVTEKDKALLKKSFGAFPLDAKQRDKIVYDTETDGFYIRLNPRDGKPHTFNALLTDGSKPKIASVLIGLDVKGGAKAALKAMNEARAGCEALRAGLSLEEAAVDDTLAYAYECWKTDKPASRNSPRKVKAPKTLREGERMVRLFAPEWMPLRIANITGAMIKLKAQKIEQGKFETPDGDLIGTTSQARNWLKSMSAIVSSAEEFHEAPNRFAIIKKKHYPKPPAKSKVRTKFAHRVLHSDEIALILNADREQFRSDGGRWIKGVGAPPPRLNVSAWRKVLAVKFQLLTGFRIGGVVGLKVAEINGVSIDREEMDKVYTDHRMPISTQLREVLDEALALKAGTDPESPKDWMLSHAGVVSSEYLFSFADDGSRFDSKGSEACRLFILAMRNIAKAYCIGAKLPMHKGKKQSRARAMTSHDLRVTARVFARRCGLSKELAKDLLGHSQNEDVTDGYDDFEEHEIDLAFDDLTVGLQKIHDSYFEIAESLKGAA